MRRARAHRVSVRVSERGREGGKERNRRSKSRAEGEWGGGFEYAVTWQANLQPIDNGLAERLEDSLKEREAASRGGRGEWREEEAIDGGEDRRYEEIVCCKERGLAVAG